MRKLFLGVLVLLLTAGCAKETTPQSKPVSTPENSIDGERIQEETDREKAVSWDMGNTYTVTKRNFTFYAHLSKDGEKAWVYKVEAEKEAAPTSLDFPNIIKKASVTRIGADMSGNPEEEFYKNVFDVWVEHAHGCDGYCRDNSKIKTMTLPATVTEIDQTAFSGMRALTKLEIPDQVKVLNAETFYGCSGLTEVNLPENLSEISPYSCFADCPRLEKITLSEKNEKFTVESGMLLSKDDRSLVLVSPKKKEVIIPDSVTTITTRAFYDSYAETITLGKNVVDLEKDCLSGAKIENILIDTANPVYEIDGQCIYRKEDGLLAVAIAKSAKLVVSDKVKKISADSILCGTLDEDRGIKLLDIPASVTWLGAEWVFAMHMGAYAKVYFRGKTPPQLEEGGEEFNAKLPVFCKVYVPKESLSAYQDWYRDAGDFKYIEKKDWHTF